MVRKKEEGGDRTPKIPLEGPPPAEPWARVFMQGWPGMRGYDPKGGIRHGPGVSQHTHTYQEHHRGGRKR